MGGLLDFMKGANDAAASTLYGPIDLLSLALRKAGLPMPDDQNVPGSKAWLQSKGLLHEAPVNAASAAGQTLGLLSPIVAQAKAPQISAGLLRMIDNANAPGAMNAATRNQAGAIVYHGSPHKFDKFDSTKIGTGEGAQVYGHGLYVAEAPDVAREYAQTLSKGNPMIDGVPLSSVIDGAQISDQAKEVLRRYVKDGDAGLINNWAWKGAPEYVEAQKVLKKATDNGGSVYKVDLPDKHIAKMLDWDNGGNAAYRAKANEASNAIFDRSGPIWDRIKDDPKRLMYTPAELAAQEFVRQGVPGIRYLDSGSRGVGAGTSNFVVFPGNEGLLKILERNGVPINGQ